VVCGPVVAELLAGVAAAHRAELWTLLSGLPWAGLGPEEWRRVGEIAAALRDSGAAVPLTDIEIGVAAAGAGALLWSHDSDFARIGSALPELERFSP
jgi:predicted nucleic acid-binding protein